MCWGGLDGGRIVKHQYSDIILVANVLRWSWLRQDCTSFLCPWALLFRGLGLSCAMWTTSVSKAILKQVGHGGSRGRKQGWTASSPCLLLLLFWGVECVCFVVVVVVLLLLLFVTVCLFFGLLVVCFVCCCAITPLFRPLDSPWPSSLRPSYQYRTQPRFQYRLTWWPP